MSVHGPPRIGSLLLVSLCVPLLALLLVACVLAPVSAPPDSPESRLAEPSTSDTGMTGTRNPALLGVYQSDVITIADTHAPPAHLLTLTLSLSADGVYEELLTYAQDWSSFVEAGGTFTSQDGSGALVVVVSRSPVWGRWEDREEFAVLLNGTEEVARFFTIGGDALSIGYLRREGMTTPLDWTLTRIADAPEPLFLCEVKQTLYPALTDRTRATNPARVGVYGTPTIDGEFGPEACTMSLFEDGWAEFFCGDPATAPAQDSVQWGLWHANAEPAAVVTLETYGSGNIMSTLTIGLYDWNDPTLMQQWNDPENPAMTHGMILTRTASLLAPQLAALHDFVFAEPAGVCLWERQMQASP